ncbi:hypothetical protein GF339_16455 [candidate division KSB3 bacterium]|uniref:Uncharacterized protein n=1 Tax=candidate division KSB3 bacterium TaxID=2044937 RepID=A0A9D5JY07_9BACT|nr:hypothetical protein [candidate division KSB3 bacterium]MBD3326180.1 hypothetical protein [candidate division KSB3 bacterium]
MFKFKDIIKMDYETYKRLITKINTSQTELSLHINTEQNSLDLKVGEALVDQYAFQVEPWMEAED